MSSPFRGFGPWYVVGQGVRALATAQRTAVARDRLTEGEAFRLARMSQAERRDYLAIKNGAIDTDGAIIPHERFVDMVDRLTEKQSLDDLKRHSRGIRVAKRWFWLSWFTGLLIGIFIGIGIGAGSR